MNAQDLRNHIKKSVGFGVGTPRTADPNESNETCAVKFRIKKSPPGSLHAYSAFVKGKGAYGFGNTPDEAKAKYLELFARFEREASPLPERLSRTPIQQGEAVQVCSAGEWPEDHGGNWTPDRIEANYAFSDWLDSHGDSLPLPTSFSDWISQNEDSIIE